MASQPVPLMTRAGRHSSSLDALIDLVAALDRVERAVQVGRHLIVHAHLVDGLAAATRASRAPAPRPSEPSARHVSAPPKGRHPSWGRGGCRTRLLPGCIIRGHPERVKLRKEAVHGIARGGFGIVRLLERGASGPKIKRRSGPARVWQRGCTISIRSRVGWSWLYWLRIRLRYRGQRLALGLLSGLPCPLGAACCTRRRWADGHSALPSELLDK